MGGPARSPYEPGEVIDTSTSPFTLKGPGVYKVEIIGGGGGGGGCMSSAIATGAVYAGGGSGAGYVGEVYLTAGTYTRSIGGGGGASVISLKLNTRGGGGGSSTLNFGDINIITAGGGEGGFANTGCVAIVGYTYASASGGTLTLNSDYSFTNYTVNRNGNAGTGAVYGYASMYGGASVYSGYGAGGSGAAAGVAGFFQLTYLRNS